MVVATLLVFNACSSASPAVVSGESLRVVGDQFVTTANLMDQALDAHAITAEQYAGWRAFGQKFQVSYPLAVQAWKTARATNDAVLEGKIAGVVTTLVTELAEFYSLVMAQMQAMKDAGGP